MTPDDTARVLRTLRADLVEEWGKGDPRNGPQLATLAFIDQRLWNISTAADFHDRAARSTP